MVYVCLITSILYVRMSHQIKKEDSKDFSTHFIVKQNLIKDENGMKRRMNDFTCNQ